MTFTCGVEAISSESESMSRSSPNPATGEARGLNAIGLITGKDLMTSQ